MPTVQKRKPTIKQRELIPSSNIPVRQRKVKETQETEELVKKEIPVRQRKVPTINEENKKVENKNVSQSKQLEVKSTEKKKTTKRNAATKKNAEKRAQEKQIKEAARIEAADIKISNERKQNNQVEEIPYEYKIASLKPNTYVIVLTPKGEIYIDPVPRYTDFINFKNFIASCPDASNTEFLNIKAEIKTIAIPNGELTYSLYDGSRKLNPFVDRFIDRKKGFKANIGGNLIFTGEGKGFTKPESEKVFNWIVKTLQTPEIILFKDNEN